MSLITATDLAKAYGAQDVLTGISLSIPYRARIALVGPNGIGKTTLLRILARQEGLDGGRLSTARNLRVGYLPQDLNFLPYEERTLKLTLWEYCLQAFERLRAQESELARLEAQMADPKRSAEALARYGALQEAFEREGGYTYPSTMRRVLAGLGFSHEMFGRSLHDLSGGERTRALLGRLLLDDPDLLLLDEPTNHLDIEAIEWLENWLKDWPGAAVIVSHDRYFLDQSVDVVWSLEAQGLMLYRGNYSAFIQQALEQSRLQRAQYEAQQETIRREEDFIRRNIAGQKTRQAQSRRKKLERITGDNAIQAVRAERRVKIDFGKVDRSGDLVVRTLGLVVRHPETDEALVSVPDLLLRRGECAALIGPNGAGKTTFLRTLLGEVQPLEGEVVLGASLRMGYLDQALGSLDPERTVLQEILPLVASGRHSEGRNLLARFLFYGEDVEKPVAVLSGGERARLALAKLALGGANFLLLDEPTTHLDLPSQEVLEQALAAFHGTILLVSHDRYLIDALGTQIWAITPSSRGLRVFEGGYEAYSQARLQEQMARKARRMGTVEEPARSAGSGRRRRELQELEKRIASLEDELQALIGQIEKAGAKMEEVRHLGSKYAEVEGELERQMAVWERLAREHDAE